MVLAVLLLVLATVVAVLLVLVLPSRSCTAPRRLTGSGRTAVRTAVVVIVVVVVAAAILVVVEVVVEVVAVVAVVVMVVAVVAVVVMVVSGRACGLIQARGVRAWPDTDSWSWQVRADRPLPLLSSSALFSLHCRRSRPP